MSAIPWYLHILEKWFGLVLQIANTPPSEQEDPRVHAMLQTALDDVVAGGDGRVPAQADGPSDRKLPPMRMRVLRGRVVPHVDLPQIQESGAHGWNLQGQGEQLRAIEQELHAVVLLFASDPAARKLRRCDWSECRAFFFAGADHRRQHSFCSSQHRRAHEHAHRDRKKVAESMRKHRAAMAARRKRAAR